MLKLTKAQRAMLVDKLPDFAHVALASLTFGQLLSEHPLSLTLAAAGVGLWAGATATALFLAKGADA